MVPTATNEDPFTQYLLGLSLVIFLVGSVGGLAQYLHWSEPPSLVYVATILVPAIGLVALAGLYERFLSHRIRRASSASDEDGSEPAEASEPTDASLEADEPSEPADERSLEADEAAGGKTSEIDAEHASETESAGVIEPSTEKRPD